MKKNNSVNLSEIGDGEGSFLDENGWKGWSSESRKVMDTSTLEG